MSDDDMPTIPTCYLDSGLSITCTEEYMREHNAIHEAWMGALHELVREAAAGFLAGVEDDDAA